MASRASISHSVALPPTPSTRGYVAGAVGVEGLINLVGISREDVDCGSLATGWKLASRTETITPPASSDWMDTPEGRALV